jgi:hypothetical protein
MPDWLSCTWDKLDREYSIPEGLLRTLVFCADELIMSCVVVL